MKPEEEKSPDEPNREDAAMDGVIREYARTGSEADDEKLISEIKGQLDAPESEQEALSNWETPKDNSWIFGGAFWKTVGAVAAVLAVFLGVQSMTVYRAIPDPTEILAYSQERFTPGEVASVRALVRNGHSMTPLANALVTAFLVSGQQERILLADGVRTDDQGNVFLSGPIPVNLEEGDYTLVIEASGETGKAKLERNIPVMRSFRTMLSTDKPLYKPGQTIHLRALSLNHDTMKPASGRKVVFEIRDPKGNKVFGKNLETSDFGIAAADFQLANQVNEGAYTIVASVDDTTSERTVKVERYTLPKYKINVSVDRSYYAPGDKAEITVDCQYTFGKPVADASVKIIAQEYIERFRDFQTLSGKTDQNGKLTFELPLKDAFVGQPLNKGDAFVRLIAEVTDLAKETRKTTHQFKVTNQPIRIEVFPESGELVQNVPNKLYILTAYPDGTPAQTKVSLSNDSSKIIETSASGIASVQITPNKRNLKLTLQAKDSKGTSSRATKALRVGQRSDAFLLRTDRALYQHGDSVQLDVFSATKARRVFVDVVKNGRSALSKSIEVENGTGNLALDLPADLVGTLQLQAYSIRTDGEMVRDTKVIQVNRSDTLTITAKLDNESYRPAEKAIIDFLVTGKDGNPVEAALSLAAVDEAVFALNDMRPGLEEMYFLIQEEILKPRYQLTAQPRIAPLTRVPVDDPELIEADVIVFSGAEGTNAQPASTQSVSFAARTKVVKEKKEDQTDRLLGLIPWIPTSMAGLLFLGISGFTILRFRQHSVLEGPSLDNPLTRQFRRRLRLVFWTFTGTLILPFLLVILGGVMGAISSETSAMFFLIVLSLIGFGILIAATAGALRCEAAKRHPVLRRTLKILPLLYIIGAVAIGSLIWAVDSRSGAWDGSNAPAMFVLIIVGMLIAASSTLTWWRPEGGRTGVFKGLLAWGIPALIICLIPIMTVVILVPGASKMNVADFAAAMPQAAMEIEEMMMDNAVMKSEAPMMTGADPGAVPVSPTEGPPAATAAPRVRKFFPETLLWQPQLLTDSNGKAKLDLALADSITTWRLSGSAVAKEGQLGSFQEGIQVFQDFFVDIDFPVALTQNDEVAVPIAIFNYLDRPQKVEIEIKPAPWFEFTGEIEGVQTVTVPANSVSNATCQLRALKPGSGKLTVFARGDQLADAVERAVTVKPDGLRIENAINGRLDGGIVTKTVTIPDGAIEGGNDLYLKVYPGAFSQVVEGMDSIFRMPHGCFEQTSSTTYPNILTLNYMRETGQVAPDIEMKALNFINIGYQRLLSYEVAGGGFDWFGNPPAHTVLTAYGLMEFVDMAKVYEIDEKVISRTRDWLLRKQGNNGTWKSPAGGIAEGAINNFQGEQNLRTTAYIAWAIAQAGGEKRLDSAFDYLVENHVETEDPYTLALCAHVFHTIGQEKAAETLFNRLDESVKIDEDGKLAWWEAGGESLTHGRGQSFSIETTAIIIQAYLAANHNIGAAHKALAWLIEQKDPRGTWHSTQATVQSMRALLAGAASSGDSGEGDYKLTFKVNGEAADTLSITGDNRDVYHLISLTDRVIQGKNEIEIAIDRDANFAYQVVSVYHEPHHLKFEQPGKRDLLTIDTEYSTTRLATDDELEVTVRLTYGRPEAAPMTLVDFGIPPGFEIVPESFQKLVDNQVIERFTANGRQVTLYFDALPGGGKPTEFGYRLRAKFPVKAQAPEVVAYQYYEPEIRDQSEPVLLTVE